MTEEGAELPLWGHVTALRSILLRILGTIALGTIFCFVFYEPLMLLAVKPFSQKNQFNTSNLQAEPISYKKIDNRDSHAHNFRLPPQAELLPGLSTNSEEISPRFYRIQPGGRLLFWETQEPQLVILTPIEGFLTALKLSFLAGCLFTSPVWIWLLMKFVSPALHRHEKGLIWPFIGVSLSFISLGCLFAYFVTLPLANAYFIAFNQNIGVNLWSLSAYLDYTLFLLLANGIAFEMGAIGIFAVHLGLVSESFLIKKRRQAILSAFILGALLTPPDVLTQLILALPLILIYEGLIIYARFMRVTISQTQTIEEE